MSCRDLSIVLQVWELQNLTSIIHQAADHMLPSLKYFFRQPALWSPAAFETENYTSAKKFFALCSNFSHSYPYSSAPGHLYFPPQQQQYPPGSSTPSLHRCSKIDNAHCFIYMDPIPCPEQICFKFISSEIRMSHFLKIHGTRSKRFSNSCKIIKLCLSRHNPFLWS